MSPLLQAGGLHLQPLLIIRSSSLRIIITRQIQKTPETESSVSGVKLFKVRHIGRICLHLFVVVIEVF